MVKKTCIKIVVALMALCLAPGKLFAQKLETTRAYAYDRGLLSAAEPFAPSGNPALLVLKNSPKFDMELYTTNMNKYCASISYPLSSFSGLGISYYSDNTSKIEKIPAGVFQTINRHHSFIIGLGQDFFTKLGHQIEIDLNVNRFSKLASFADGNASFTNDQRLRILYRLGLYKKLSNSLSIGLLSPPLIRFDYHSHVEPVKPSEKTWKYWQEIDNNATFPMAAVQWSPSSKLAFALSNRSKLRSDDVQLASEVKIKNLTLTHAIRREKDELDYIIGFGGYYKGFEIFSAYNFMNRDIRFALSFAPERQRELIELQNLKVAEQVLYPYKLWRGIPSIFAEIVLKNKTENPAEITVRLSGADLPSLAQSVKITDSSPLLMTLPVPNNLARLPAGTYRYDLEVFAYYRGKQAIKRIITFEMKDKHDWAGDPRDLVYFVNPLNKQVMTMARSIATDRSPTQGPSDATCTAKHFYNFIRDSVHYLSDPTSIFALRDRVQYPAETLELKTGDCEDLSILMISLLRSVGIDASFMEISDPTQSQGHILILFDSQKTMSQLIASNENLQNYIVRGTTEGVTKFFIPLELTKSEMTFKQAWKYAIDLFQRCAVDRKGLIKGWVKIIDTKQQARP